MSHSLSFLVLGGTGWLGGALAARAAAEGHHVTCLARGVSGPVPVGVTFVPGDRWTDQGYDAVVGREWDVVADVSRQPGQVRSALGALAARARHWVYVSTVSVYADHSTPGADESAALLEAWDGAGEAPPDRYGEAKVSCETACRAAVPPENLVVARAGLIVGYGDPTDRFGYWPARFARARAGDSVLVPPMDTPVQVIDVEDLATWLVQASAARVAGTYDTVGPLSRFSDVSDSCRAATDNRVERVSPGEDWLLEAGVEPWAGPRSLPLWLPRAEYAGMATRSGAAAQAAGLTHRSLAATVEASLRWERRQGLTRPRRAGLTGTEEADLLAQWRTRRS